MGASEREYTVESFGSVSFVGKRLMRRRPVGCGNSNWCDEGEKGV